jgi:hypothetical protein
MINFRPARYFAGISEGVSVKWITPLSSSQR